MHDETVNPNLTKKWIAQTIFYAILKVLFAIGCLYLTIVNVIRAEPNWLLAVLWCLFFIYHTEECVKYCRQCWKEVKQFKEQQKLTAEREL